MSATHDHDRFSEDVGAYLLGALELREEQAFESHLDTCHLCQEEVALLTVARDALPRSVNQLEPPPELKASLMATVESEAAARAELLEPTVANRRARAGGWRQRLFARPAFAAAAAALLVILGIGAGVLVGGVGDGGTAGDVRTVGAAVDTQRLASQASAKLVYDEDRGDGHLHVTGMPLPVEKDVYEVWVKKGDEVSPASLFEVNQDGDGVASVPDLKDAEAVYVTREKRGGADLPTEDPVVTIEL